MENQMPKINSKRQVLQSKPPRLYLQTLMVGLLVLALSICSIQTATCPPSVPSSTATTTEQCSFSGYTNTYTDGMAVGPVSNSLYYLYGLSPSPNAAIVRKVDASGLQTWMASIGFWPINKSLSVDAAEQNLYLASSTNPLVVLKLAASGGSIVTQHQL